MAQVTQVSTHPAEPPGSVGQATRPGPYGPFEPHEPTGPVDRLMDWLIRTLAWSRLSKPKVAVSLSAAGLLLGMLLGATAPNAETLRVRLPLSTLLPSLGPHQHVLASLMMYSADILACLGLAGMLWAHSQGWRPNPKRLFLVSAAVVSVIVCLTPVGSCGSKGPYGPGRVACPTDPGGSAGWVDTCVTWAIPPSADLRGRHPALVSPSRPVVCPGCLVTSRLTRLKRHCPA